VRLAAGDFLESLMRDNWDRYVVHEAVRRRAMVFLVFGHYACEKSLEGMRFDPLGLNAGLLNAVLQSPVHNLRRLFCAMQIAWAYQHCIEDLEAQGPWVTLLGEAACDMYMQAPVCFDLVGTCYADKNQSSPTSESAALANRLENCSLEAAYANIGWKEPHSLVTFALMSGMRNYFLNAMEAVGKDSGSREDAAVRILSRRWNL